MTWSYEISASPDIRRNQVGQQIHTAALITFRTQQHPKIYKCNRTEWGPIRSVIIRVITKSDDREAGDPGAWFVEDGYDYRLSVTWRVLCYINILRNATNVVFRLTSILSFGLDDWQTDWLKKIQRNGCFIQWRLLGSNQFRPYSPDKLWRSNSNSYTLYVFMSLAWFLPLRVRPFGKNCYVCQFQ